MTTSGVRVRIPQVRDIETAVLMYYERIELSSDDIRRLFGGVSKGTVCKLKQIARELSAERGTPVWNASMVNTEDAFVAWGLDIAQLENRLAKINRYKREDARK